MAISIDNHAEQLLTTGAASPFTFTFAGSAVARGANGLVLFMGIGNTTDAQLGTVTLTYDNAGTPQTMTKIGSHDDSANGTSNGYIFGLLAPHPGVALQYSFAWTGAATAIPFTVAFISLFGVDQTSPFARTFSNFKFSVGVTTTPTLTINTSPGNIVLGQSSAATKAYGSTLSGATWFIDNTNFTYGLDGLPVSGTAFTLQHNFAAGASDQDCFIGCNVESSRNQVLLSKRMRWV